MFKDRQTLIRRFIRQSPSRQKEYNDLLTEQKKKENEHISNHVLVLYGKMRNKHIQKQLNT